MRGVQRKVPLLFLLLTFGFISESKPEEVESAALIGKWHWKGKEKGVSMSTVSEYRKDRTYHAKTDASFFKIATKVTCSGTWRIKGDTLTVNITKSSHPKYVPVGEVYTMSELKISPEKMTYRFRGKQEHETRVDSTE